MKFRIQFSLILFNLAVLTSSHAQDLPSPLKVMTYNVWNGFDWGKDSTRHERFIEWIKSKNPDVLALQELCGYTEEKLKADALAWGHPYAVLLKTEGYPTALTSKRPITLKERSTNPFWHGLLHCETYGIDFFVVHLSPADVDFRYKEAGLIQEKIKNLENESYIVLGDFNAHSPMDAYWLEKRTALKERLRNSRSEKYWNLREGEFDYSVMSTLLSTPLVDVANRRLDLESGFTFPSSILIGKYENTPEKIVANRVRIDYILVSPSLGKICRRVELFNTGETNQISDHFPMIAEFSLTNR